MVGLLKNLDVVAVLSLGATGKPHTTPEVRQAIKSLSPVTVERLATMSSTGLLYQKALDPGTKGINDTLVSSKLAKELTIDELSAASTNFGNVKFVYGISLTPLGSDARAYVEGVLAELVDAD